MRYILSAALFFLLGSIAAQLPASGLIAHYPLDNSAADLSGKNNNGEIKGTVVTTEDRFGNACGAMKFNGVDGYIRVPGSVSLQSPGSSLSITAWFKTEKSKTPSAPLEIVLLSKSGTFNKAEAKAQYRFLFTRSFGDATANIFLSHDATAVDNSYNVHPIEDGQWYFLSVVYEENWVNISLNNKLIAQAIIKKPFTPNDLDLEIGRDLSAGGKYFNGSLDDIRIYNRGLSPYEVSMLFDDKSGKEKGGGFTMNLPETIRMNADAGKCSAVVSYKEPTASMGCGKAELKLVKGTASGSAFKVGRNVVAYQATGSSGQSFLDSFDIIIADNEAPVFKRPADISASVNATSKKVKIDYPVPAASDNCPNIKVEMLSGMASGSEFPVGVTAIRYKATDASGNTAEVSFNVTVSVVKDVVRILHCSDDITVYGTADAENVIVKYETPYVEADGVKIPMNRTNGSSSGSLFKTGKTEVVYETEDTGAAHLVCRFNVFVKDTIPPAISCPMDITKVGEPGLQSMRITYPLPKATDSGTPISVKIISGFMSGSFFPVGTNVVKFEAEDEAGNKSACSFKITVEEPKVVAKEPVKVLPPAETKTETAKAPESKPVEKPKPAEVKETPVREAKPVPEIIIEKEEKIKQAEKVFLPPAPEKKPEVKTEEKPVVVHEEKEAEVPAPKPAPVVEVKEKEKPVVVAKPVPSVAVPAKPKDTAPVKAVKPAAPPILKCADNMVKKNDPGKCGAAVNYLIPEVKNGQEVKIMQTKGVGSGSFFKTGTTTNTFSASDAWNQTRECSFNVTIKDLESPSFKCPGDTVIMLPANRRGIIYYYTEPGVKDNCGVDSFIQVAGPKNGCFLEVGVHPFIYKAIDASGNYEICTHSVIIKSAPPVANVEPPLKLADDLSLGSDSIHYEYKSKVQDCFLTIFLYDDGEEDGDIVSVIFNGQVIINKEMIRLKEHSMIKRNLVLDTGNENYLVSKAWNTGKYGLNTLKIDVYEGNIENEKKDLKNIKPVLSKVLHSRPGNAGGIILKCGEQN